MEIKKIEKHAVDYPKTNEISKEDIKRNIPKKFLKFAVALAFMQGSLTKVNASIINTQLAGDIEYIEPVISGGLEYINPMYTVSSNVESISLCVFVLSVISIVVTKIVYKIKKIEKPVPKGLKILAILSGVLAVVAAIGILVLGN